MIRIKSAEVAVGCSNVLGESPTWSTREQALYWVDIRTPSLHRYSPSSGHCDAWRMPDLCSAVVMGLDGVFVASRTSLMRFDEASGTARDLFTVEPSSLNNRLNEARVDRKGRLWIGSMRDFGTAVTGSLYSVDPFPLHIRRVLKDIRIPNSLGWSPDGRTMYFADSRTGAIRAYAFDSEAGTIGPMRVLIEDGAVPGKPDGCAVDSQGFVWSARYGGGCIARISPAGQVDAIVEFPTSQPTSCVFGGADFCTLYVTTARQRLTDAQLKEEPAAGHLFAIPVDVPGLPEIEFHPSHAPETI